MKKVLAALLTLALAPAVALAEEAPPAAPASTASSPADSQPPATPSAPVDPKAAPAAAVEIATAAPGSEEAMEGRAGFHVGVELDHSLGQGTFAKTPYYSFLGGSLAVAPSYAFKAGGMKLSASARASVSYEYTLPDNDIGRRFDWSDLRVGLSAPSLFKEKFSGISLSPSLNLTVPLTLRSLHTGSITTLSAGVGLGRSFFDDKLSLRYRLSGGRGLHATQAVGVTPAAGALRDAQGNLVYVCRTDDQICGVGGINTAWSLSNSLGAEVQATEKLSFSLSFAISQRWKYATTTEVDEFTPKALDSNGNSVVKTGAGMTDMTAASIGASYSLTDALSLSFGIGTEGPPKIKDGTAFRFPFFDFRTPEDNLTSFSLTLSANF